MWTLPGELASARQAGRHQPPNHQPPTPAHLLTPPQPPWPAHNSNPALSSPCSGLVFPPFLTQSHAGGLHLQDVRGVEAGLRLGAAPCASRRNRHLLLLLVVVKLYQDLTTSLLTHACLYSPMLSPCTHPWRRSPEATYQNRGKSKEKRAPGEAPRPDNRSTHLSLSPPCFYSHARWKRRHPEAV